MDEGDSDRMPTAHTGADRKRAPSASALTQGLPGIWKTVDEEPVAVATSVRSHVYALTTDAAAEARSQVAWSMRDAVAFARGLVRDARGAMAQGRDLLLQPVWIPRRNKAPKQRTRLALFFGDVLRFGTTFACLFIALFLALNYQSVSTIVSARIDPLASVDEANRMSRILTGGSDNAKSTHDNAHGTLLAALTVGPPDNRLLIPKLGLNVPVVTPTSEPLLREDWAALETEIQQSLEDGVVHYPGTARPGQAGNFFVTGHSSYYPGLPGDFKTVFARLGELEAGDEYWVYHNGDKHRYRVTEVKEVSPNDVSVLDQPTDRRLGTLMTCTPVGTTLRRLIVQAQEVDLLTGEALAVGQHTTKSDAPKVRMDMLAI